MTINTDTQYEFRAATQSDLNTIVSMLANDPLGAQRESHKTQMDAAYLAAFNSITNDANNEILLICQEGMILGFLQLTYIPSLTYTGSWRAQIEGVRVVDSHRGQGIGQKLIQHAIDLAQQRNCVMVQLTSDKRRPAAIGFYKKLGFVDSHEGMKYHIKHLPVD